MLGIVIITHGNLAQSLLQTAETIIGKQDNVYAINFEANESFDTLKQKVSSVVSNSRDGCIIFTDIFGGSPSNVCLDYLSNPNIRVITGVNIPMLLEAFANRNSTDINLVCNKIIAAGNKSIVDMGEIMKNKSKKAVSKI